jgi:hypothetical protein
VPTDRDTPTAEERLAALEVITAWPQDDDPHYTSKATAVIADAIRKHAESARLRARVAALEAALRDVLPACPVGVWSAVAYSHEMTCRPIACPICDAARTSLAAYRKAKEVLDAR